MSSLETSAGPWCPLQAPRRPGGRGTGVGVPQSRAAAGSAWKSACPPDSPPPPRIGVPGVVCAGPRHPRTRCQVQGQQKTFAAGSACSYVARPSCFSKGLRPRGSPRPGATVAKCPSARTRCPASRGLPSGSPGRPQEGWSPLRGHRLLGGPLPLTGFSEALRRHSAHSLTFPLPPSRSGCAWPRAAAGGWWAQAFRGGAGLSSGARAQDTELPSLARDHGLPGASAWRLSSLLSAEMLLRDAWV